MRIEILSPVRHIYIYNIYGVLASLTRSTSHHHRTYFNVSNYHHRRRHHFVDTHQSGDIGTANACGSLAATVGLVSSAAAAKRATITVRPSATAVGKINPVSMQDSLPDSLAGSQRHWQGAAA